MSARSFTLNKVRQGNITVLNDGTAIQLHNTVVAKIDNGAIIVNSGGWHTNTTKTAINRFLSLIGSDFGVMQKKGEWFLTNGKTTVPFTDNMKVPGPSKLEKALA